MSDEQPPPAPEPEAHALTPNPEPGGERYKSRIVIRPNGEVVIENLSLELMELAEALDPDGAIACELNELLRSPIVRDDEPTS